MSQAALDHLKGPYATRFLAEGVPYGEWLRIRDSIESFDAWCAVWSAFAARAEAEADRSGRRLLGFYHSHPDHPAEPSAFDLEHAWPNLSYVIVSVRGGRVDQIRSWRLRHDRLQFDEESVG